MRALVILLLMSTPPQQREEPHPFPPDQLARYEELFRRLDAGDRNVEPEARRFLQANPENPRAHYLAGVAALQAGNRLQGRLNLQEALRIGIGPARRRASLLATLAQAWVDDDIARARAYMNEALRIAPGDERLLRFASQLDLRVADFTAARPRLEELGRRRPEDGDIQAELATVLWETGDRSGAVEALRRARALGVVRPYFAEIERQHARIERQHRREQWALLGLIGLGIALAAIWLWLGALAVLTALLARAGLGDLVEVRAGLQTGVHTSGERWVERIYGLVVWSALILLVVSLPILLLVTVAIAAGLIWGMLAIHHVYPWLILLALLGAGGAAWGILRALFLRLGPERRRVATRADEPDLFALLDEVAAVASSEPVREVVLEADASVGVLEQGPSLAVLLGRGRRVLNLGYGALVDLTVGEFRAVLAHEYGHFSHGETRLTPLIARVMVVSLLMLHGVARAGWLTYLNPAFWFLRAFVHLFGKLTSAQGRRRELLADRVSAMAYGGETFGRALLRVTYAQEDLVRAMGVLAALRAMGLPAEGLYEVQQLKLRELPAPLRSVNVRDQMPDEYDSHPPTDERIRAVHGIEGTVPDDARQAIVLLRDPGKLATELSVEVLRKLPPPTAASLPRPSGSVDEVTRALSHLFDAQELARREPRHALPFLESSVTEASRALGEQHPVLRPSLRRLAELRQASGDRAGAEEAARRARHLTEPPSLSPEAG
jgi:Zn-dependent protease with chaperone function